MTGAAFFVSIDTKQFVHFCMAVNTPLAKVKQAASKDKVKITIEIVHKVHSALKENILAKERKK